MLREIDARTLGRIIDMYLLQRVWRKVHVYIYTYIYWTEQITPYAPGVELDISSKMYVTLALVIIP